jgi:16S rRNA (guanine966-N2)-methyltransferase
MRKGTTGQVRIIGGEWRGRKLPVPNIPGLRPSGDRGRETLFNWLAEAVPGARCADLFAGSGALGFEAASRGATQVDMVEISPVAVSALLDSAQKLGAAQVTVHRANVVDWLRGCEAHSLDIVFMDPPFDSGLAVRATRVLQERDCVTPGGFVYIETPVRFPELTMGAGFGLHREQVLGEVRMQLFRRLESTSAP